MNMERKGLWVMQRTQRGALRRGPRLPQTQGRGEGVEMEKLLASQGEGRRLWPSAFWSE